MGNGAIFTAIVKKVKSMKLILDTIMSFPLGLDGFSNLIEFKFDGVWNYLNIRE